MATLPSTIELLDQRWDIVEKAPMAPTWDFMWNGPGEEGREKQFVQQAFLTGGNSIPVIRRYLSEAMYVADSALKVTKDHPIYDLAD